MSESLQRLERRVQQLEDAVDARKYSPQEISRTIHELLDMRQSFYTHMDARPTIKEGLQKCSWKDQALLRAADDQEGTSNWTAGLKTEVLLHELPRLQGLSAEIDKLHQLEPLLNLTPRSDYVQLTGKISGMKTELRSMLEKVSDADQIHRDLTRREALAVAYTEEKLMDIDSKLST